MGISKMSFLPDRKYAPCDLGRVLVLGLGKSGKSVVRYCAGLLGDRVQSLFVAAGQENDDSRGFLQGIEREIEQRAGQGAEQGLGRASGQPVFSYAFGDDAVARFDAIGADFEDLGTRFDLCIASPGIPFWHELYQTGAAASAELISEVEFSWRESTRESVWVALTGTNGKTTTTSLCAHILREGGLEADAVGNIGEVCLDAVQAGRTQVYVAEVSSYQLASMPHFCPQVAVLLNITPDHGHWHKTFEAYRDAKFSLLDNMGKAADDGMFAPVVPADPVAVLEAPNDVVRGKVRELRQMSRQERGFDYIPLGTADGIRGDMRARCGADNAAFLGEGDRFVVAYGGREHEVGNAGDLQIPGDHNVSNALAAAAAAVALGVDDAAIARALGSFEPLAHRIEPCGSAGGVEFFNDSKGTNVDATLKALEAFPGRRLTVLLGGDDKGTDLSELVGSVQGHAVAAVCYGEAGPRFEEAFSAAAGSAPEGFSCLSAEHMADALEVACGIACAGDIVLLSPACASFDEFRSFEHRGDEFKRMVSERPGWVPAGGMASCGVAADEAVSSAGPAGTVE